MKVLEDQKELTEIEKAQLVLQQEKEERLQKCMKAIEQELEVNGCQLVIKHSVNENNQIMSIIQLITL